MWNTNSWYFMGTIQSGLLSFCHIVFDIRHRNRFIISMGGCYEGFGCAGFGLRVILFNYFNARIGLCMEERSFEMEVKDIYVRNMKYEDFKENEYLEEYVEELRKNGVNIFVGKLNDMINW